MTPDHHSLFDSVIRQQLTELPPPTASAAGWERLSSDLDEGGADTARFDEHFYEALTNTSAGALTTATGWSLLADRMDGVSSISSGDAYVAEQLNGLTPITAPAAGWERLSEQLDADAARLMDTSIARQLAIVEPVVVSGWAGLAARLELIGQRRELVAAMKVTELCLLLSFLLLTLHPNGLRNYLPPSVEIDNFPIALASPATLPVTATSATASPVLSERAATEEIIPIGGTAAPRTKKATSATVPGTLGKQTTPIQLIAAALESREAISFATTDIVPVSRADVIPVTEVDRLDYAINLRSITPAPALQLEPVRTGNTVEYYLNLFYSPFDFNEVITRETFYRKTYTIDGERRFTYGHSGGALIEAVRGNTGVQFGMIYGKRSYIPTQLKWFNADEDGPGNSLVEPFRGGYSRLIYNSVTLPLHFTQTILRRPNWKVTARVGGGVNVILKSAFYTEEGDELSVQELTRNSSPFAFQNEGAGRAKSTEGSVYDLANPEPGYFQGGSLISNSRFEIGGGVRIERMLGDNVSIYVAPSFGRTLYITPEAGVGPYFDRVHTYNFRFGSRFLLGKK